MQQYTLTQSYNSGTIDSNGTAGGIIGYARLDLNINNCYNVGDAFFKDKICTAFIGYRLCVGGTVENNGYLTEDQLLQMRLLLLNYKCRIRNPL